MMRPIPVPARTLRGVTRPTRLHGVGCSRSCECQRSHPIRRPARARLKGWPLISALLILGTASGFGAVVVADHFGLGRALNLGHGVQVMFGGEAR